MRPEKRAGKTGGLILVTGVLLLLFLSCQSTGAELRVETMEAAHRGELAELEEMIIALDRPSAENRDRRATARARIVELEKIPSADTEYCAALAAWSGRLYIHEGKNNEAIKALKNSQSFSPGNLQSLILAARLEKDSQKRLALIDRELRIAGPSAGGNFPPEDAISPVAALQIERGLVLMELKRYGEAAGAFDTAFVGTLPPVYREIYGARRDAAWELRNAPAAEDKTTELMEQEGLDWANLIELTKAETDLLRFLTAGRDLPPAELFDRLLERNFIPYTQDITRNEWPSARPRMEDRVLRSGAAWYLWRLYAEHRADRGLLSRYSSRYSRMANPRSPIADLPLLSPFFDAILGCVETELMSLPDGRNFKPGGAVRGAEFAAMLKF
jgi:tetratricopeptide (TPR) repeat protein